MPEKIPARRATFRLLWSLTLDYHECQLRESSSFEAAVVFANFNRLSQQHSTTITSSITASTTAASQLPHVLHSRDSKTTNPCNHRNQQYSIIGLTNAAGTLVERYTYTAYGTLGIYDASGTVRTTSSYANRYTYTGREYDPDLNLYHFRARWYDPATGGFISRDPLGYVDGRSLYRGYFGVSAVDWSGFCKCDTGCEQIVGGEGAIISWIEESKGAPYLMNKSKNSPPMDAYTDAAAKKVWRSERVIVRLSCKH